ncbi:MAG: hypothetical protein H6R26_832 [Proteobacteria bacterium]|nr:hypothetical protein [Pseudomonadota bacterium]
MGVIKDPAAMNELYSGDEFQPLDTGMTQVQEFLRVQKLFPLHRFLLAVESLVNQSDALRDKLSSNNDAQQRLASLKHNTRKLRGIIGHIRAQYDERVYDEEIELLNWHFLRNKNYVKLRQARRTDAVLTYRVASELFNAQLEADQKGNPLLGVAPCRLDEKPTTANALRVALIRERKQK